MSAPDQVPSWINKGQAKSTWPDWLSAVAIDRPEANGSFMIRSRHGQARVHHGAMALLFDGHVYTCAANEARETVAELRAAAALVPPTPVPGGRQIAEKVADVADRADDTDEISRAIRREKGEQEPSTGTIPTRKLEEVKPPVLTKPNPAAGPIGKVAPARGSMPSIEWIQLDRLLVDDSYQRSVDTGPSRTLIARIGREWDWRLCVPLMVSRRPDGLYVIDGQHRLFGARLRPDVPQLPCCISVYDGPAGEAAMFVAANRERRAMNRLDDFHAAQAGGNEDAVAVAALITDVGFTVSRRTGSAAWAPGEVAFTSSISKARRRFGEPTVREALRLLAEVFPGERLIVGSSIFTAIVGLLRDKPPQYSRDRAISALRTFNMEGWASFISSSRGGSNRDKALKDMLRAAYDDVVGENP